MGTVKRLGPLVYSEDLIYYSRPDNLFANVFELNAEAGSGIASVSRISLTCDTTNRR